MAAKDDSGCCQSNGNRHSGSYGGRYGGGSYGGSYGDVGTCVASAIELLIEREVQQGGREDRRLWVGKVNT
ncbi:hypothetical protein CBR_g51984 [Chara braunii]|uniref:Uncharacterized protein n=1 Tax=Chara braunii TaxID=69332 RepID=A0A388K6K3_CHABU|nr:hypothetical protein CBR_g51984 [Chara braunii]|eukprot:GBG65684.1 hypothetical protein CBR_g51984 [Chara braunii]